jgi:hypothetical protein
VEIEECTPVPERLGEISKSLNLGRGYAEHWERFSCRELVQVLEDKKLRVMCSLLLQQLPRN